MSDATALMHSKEKRAVLVRDAFEGTQVPISGSTKPATTSHNLGRLTIREESNVSVAFDERATGQALPDRMYPQAFDANSKAGFARVQIEKAKDDAIRALDFFNVSDISSMATQFSLIAACLLSAYRRADFNDALASVVAYIRRAVLVVDPTSASRQEVNSLVTALRSITMNPMIDYEEAANLVNALAAAGWNGENDAVAELVSAFLEDKNDGDETSEREVSLFRDDASITAGSE